MSGAPIKTEKHENDVDNLTDAVGKLAVTTDESIRSGSELCQLLMNWLPFFSEDYGGSIPEVPWVMSDDPLTTTHCFDKVDNKMATLRENNIWVAHVKDWDWRAVLGGLIFKGDSTILRHVEKGSEGCIFPPNSLPLTPEEKADGVSEFHPKGHPCLTGEKWCALKYNFEKSIYGTFVVELSNNILLFVEGYHGFRLTLNLCALTHKKLLRMMKKLPEPKVVAKKLLDWIKEGKSVSVLDDTSGFFASLLVIVEGARNGFSLLWTVMGLYCISEDKMTWDAFFENHPQTISGVSNMKAKQKDETTFGEFNSTTFSISEKDENVEDSPYKMGMLNILKSFLECAINNNGNNVNAFDLLSGLINKGESDVKAKTEEETVVKTEAEDVDSMTDKSQDCEKNAPKQEEKKKKKKKKKPKEEESC